MKKKQSNEADHEVNQVLSANLSLLCVQGDAGVRVVNDQGHK